MKTIQVKIVKYVTHEWATLGSIHTVKAEPVIGELTGLPLYESVEHPGARIFANDVEVLPETIVEHGGKYYKVPTWGKYLTRDTANSEVYVFENKPVWAPMDSAGQWKWQNAKASHGRVTVATEYIAPKPQGNFIKEI